MIVVFVFEKFISCVLRHAYFNLSFLNFWTQINFRMEFISFEIFFWFVFLSDVFFFCSGIYFWKDVLVNFCCFIVSCLHSYGVVRYLKICTKIFLKKKNYINAHNTVLGLFLFYYFFFFKTVMDRHRTLKIPRIFTFSSVEWWVFIYILIHICENC